MKTNLEKLTALLCECEEVEKQIKELKFGTKVLLKDYFEPKKITLGKDFDFNEFQVIFTIDNQNKFFNKNDIEKTIGNPIEYHHLMTYCERKKIPLIIKNNTICFGFFYENTPIYEKYISINNTKHLHQQGEETLGKIFNFLKG